MSDFKAKMHSLSAGAPPQTPLEEITALSKIPSCIRGLYTAKRRERGRKGKGERRGEKGKWCGGGIWPTPKFWHGTPYSRPLAGRGREGEGRGEERKGRRGQKAGKGEGRKVGTCSPPYQSFSAR